MQKPEQNLYNRLKRKLDLYRPELGVVLSMYAKGKPEVASRVAFSGNDASADLILHLTETLLAIEQLRTELETVVFEQEESGGVVDPKMTRLMADLMKLEPLALNTAIVGVEMHGVIWGISHKPTKEDAWKAKRDKELREIQDDLTRKKEARKSRAHPSSEVHKTTGPRAVPPKERPKE